MPKKTLKVKNKKPAKLNFGKDIWPQERDFMARPDRLKYVRKLIKSNGCVFCESFKKPLGVESLVMWQNDLAVTMLNKYPYNNGHVLVLPKRHCGDLLGLSDEEYRVIQLALRQAVKAIVSHYKCPGFNLGLNHGSVAGAGIPEHLHWHVVPRWQGDTNFFPIIAETKVLAETVAQTYEHLAPHFSNFKIGAK